jgi:hypothetical protein
MHYYRDVNVSEGDPCATPLAALDKLGKRAFHFQGKLLKSALPARSHSTLSLTPPKPFLSSPSSVFLLHFLSFHCVEVVYTRTPTSLSKRGAAIRPYLITKFASRQSADFAARHS